MLVDFRGKREFNPSKNLRRKVSTPQNVYNYEVLVNKKKTQFE